MQEQPKLVCLEAMTGCTIRFQVEFVQQFSFWRSTGIDLRLELKPLDHEMHQVIPTIKDHITG